MNQWSARLVLLAMAPLVLGLPAVSLAQRDTVELVSGSPVRGSIQASSRNKLSVQKDGGVQQVDGWQIRRVRFDDEPNDLTRARSAFADDRYNEVIAALDQAAVPPEKPLMAADVAYLRAMASGRIALTGGAVTATQAIDLLRSFYSEHADHYLLETVLELYADLTMAQGNFAEAAKMYEQLSAGDWPQIAFESRIRHGRSLILDGKFSEAVTVLDSVEGIDSAEDYALQGKSLAKCLKALALARSGRADEAESIAMDIIRNTDARNATLMGWAYNALGASHAERGNLKEAARAWLHTDLLFMKDPDAHAEALFGLAQVWSKLQRQDRALESRQKIRDRYRNSFWASRVEANSQ